MHFREAVLSDIPQIMDVRLSVKENILSNPDLVTEADCVEFLSVRGKGWVCESSGKILGFAIVDMIDHNIWALFVRPDDEGRGIGKRLHHWMMDWYFTQTQDTAWLGTSPGTRAEQFYRHFGWMQTGFRKNGEIRFEMTAAVWGILRAKKS